MTSLAGRADWIVFWCVIAIAFVADALLARRGGSAPRSAALWSVLWIALALLVVESLLTRRARATSTDEKA